ncbi:hypothetical protein GCM10027020_06420 [Nocardioides salsibiostraticola]
MIPDPDPAVTEVGERLAAWLEGLGLTDHLEAAGLPLLERDQGGRAIWTDPRTGKVLTSVQLDDLDRVLRKQGTEPEHAVPLPLVQIARRVRLRAQLLETDWFTYASLAERRGATLEATRFAVHKAGGEHRLLVVTTDEGVIVPAFQLDPSGQVRSDLIAVLEPLLAAGMDPWRVWTWLTQPAALLGGLVPEQAAADQEDRDMVLNAAIRLAERVALS